MSNNKLEFIEKMSKAAQDAHNTWKIPVSLTIAQACLESYFGVHDLGVKNLFGFKGTGPAGFVIKNTKEWDRNKKVYITVAAKFRAYHSYNECVMDHNRLLATSKYYQEARKHMENSIEFAHELTGVYATDPLYGDKLESIIKKYNLQQYDKAVH